VAVVVDKTWTATEIDSGHEDVICVSVTCPAVARTYTVVGVYIPYGSDTQHAKNIMATISYISERHDNVVVMGDFNAHTGSQQERLIDNPNLPAGNGIPPRVTHADVVDTRGELLLELAADQDLVMTNGRKDGSRTSPSALLTYVNSAHRPPHKSLIDYVLLPPDLYCICASHQNIFHHNHTIKTSHALVCVALKEYRKHLPGGPPPAAGVDPAPAPHAPRRDHKQEVKKVFDKYALQMDDEIRIGFTEASDHSLSVWLTDELPKHIKLAGTSPQAAVNEATKTFTGALLKAANSSVPMVEVKRRCADPSKYPRKPRYWNDQIQVLDTAARTAARHFVEVVQRSPDDTTSIAVLRDNHKKAQDHLYEARRSNLHSMRPSANAFLT
jgi:hypothetical protein